MSVSFDQLLKQINHKILPFYFIVDETGFFSNHIVERLKYQYLDKPNAQNCMSFDAKGANLDAFVEEVQTVSLFSSKKMFIFRQSQGFLKNPCKTLLEVLKGDLRDRCVIFVASKSSKNALAKHCQKEKKYFLFRKPYDSQMSFWIQWIAKQRKKYIDPEAVELLLAKVGSHLGLLEKEIEKLDLYIGPRDRIEASDVKALLYSTRSHSVFELSEAIGRKHKGEALTLLENLFQEGESEVFIFSMVMRQLRNLRKSIEWRATKSDAEVQRLLGIHPYFWNQFRSQRDQWQNVLFEPLWGQASEVDKKLKTSSVNKKNLITGFVSGALS